jgi:aryl-alcohol dehydrogenase-like predicted oxidoreductase
MIIRPLGRTGIRVSEYCLGAMMFGSMGNPDRDAGVRVIHRALDAGINFIDTAALYSNGESEEIVGQALKGRRADVILSTKIIQFQGLSRGVVIQSLDDSLRRLGTDYVDLYQIHRPDPDTDIDETLGALSDLVRAGKVRAIGTSTFSPDQLVEAQWAAEKRGHIVPSTEQPPYSILNRAVEATTLPIAQRYGMGVLTWGPLSSGWLSGKARSESRRAATIEGGRFDTTIHENKRKEEAVEALAKLALESGITLPHLALAFVRAHPAVTSAIIGPRTVEQLESLLDGVDVTLTGDILDRIDEIVPPGTDFNAADAYAVPHPALARKELRRRPG